MRLFGKLAELTQAILKKSGFDVTVDPGTTTGDKTITLPDSTDTLVGRATTDTLTNKSIDADNNTISELETDNLKAGVLNTDTGLSGASDTQVGSALAVKTYVDDSIATKDEASEISFDPAPSSLVATDVQVMGNELAGRLDATELATGLNASDLIDHENTTTNPHVVTKAQVGLGSADDTADLDKPISTATQTALDLKADDADLTTHTGDTLNPHSVTKSQVGLGSADDTSDLNKPISTATQSALDLKVDETITVTGDEVGTTGGGDLTANRTVSIKDNPTIGGVSHMALPSGTTAQRPGSPANNLLRHNSDDNVLERYDGTSWTGVGGGGLEVEFKSANYTAEAGFEYVQTADFTAVTFPAGSDGDVIRMTRDRAGGVDWEASAITITPDGAETIDGAATFELDTNTADFIYFVYQASATNWISVTPITAGLDAGGGGGLTVVFQSSNYVAAVDTNNVQTADFTAVTLPVGVDGATIQLSREDSVDWEASPVIVTPNGAETIDGSATYELDTNVADFVSLIYEAASTNWIVITPVTAGAGEGGGGLTPTPIGADPGSTETGLDYIMTAEFNTLTVTTIATANERMRVSKTAGVSWATTPVTVSSAGSDTFNGDATLVLDSDGVDYVDLISESGNWIVQFPVTPSAVIGNISRVASVSQGANQVGFASGATVNPVTYDTVDFDPFNMWNASLNRWEPDVAGYYRIYSTIQIRAGAAVNAIETAIGIIDSTNYSQETAGKGGDSNEFSTQYGSRIMYFNGTTDTAKMLAIAIIAGANTWDIGGGDSHANFGIELIYATDTSPV
jgi:hypothetical protein